MVRKDLHDIVIAPNRPKGLLHRKLDFSNHIHISGFARSGTTLIKNLFWCFENTIVVPAETVPDLSRNFLGTEGERQKLLTNTTNIIVTKQPGSSGDLTTYKNLNMLYMVRDPRDLLASINPGLPIEQRHSMGVLSDYFDVLDGLPSEVLKVKYEQLVDEPNTVQSIIAERFNLTPKYLFTDWPDIEFYEQDMYVSGMRGARKISDEHIGQWKSCDRTKDILKLVKESSRIREGLKKYGYSI